MSIFFPLPPLLFFSCFHPFCFSLISPTPPFFLSSSSFFLSFLFTLLPSSFFLSLYLLSLSFSFSLFFWVLCFIFYCWCWFPIFPVTCLVSWFALVLTLFACRKAAAINIGNRESTEDREGKPSSISQVFKCSSEESAEARDQLRQFLFPVIEGEGYTLPLACPFKEENDLFAPFLYISLSRTHKHNLSLSLYLFSLCADPLQFFQSRLLHENVPLVFLQWLFPFFVSHRSVLWLIRG